MQVAVSDIILKKRVRQDLGDLKPLMESLRKYGQLNPVIITREHELIAGHRRLESAKQLGWYTVDAVCVDRVSDAEKLEMELEENVHRKDLSPSELLEGYTRLEKLLKPRFIQRVRNSIRDFFSRLFGRKTKERVSTAAVPGSPMGAVAEDGEETPLYEYPPAT